MGWGYFLVARKDHGTDHEQRKELITVNAVHSSEVYVISYP